MLADAGSKALSRKATVDWENLQTDVAAYLEGSGDDNWRETFVPLIEGVVTDQAKNWTAQFGIQFSVQQLMASEWLANYTLEFARPIMETTLTGISDVLTRAQLDGWGMGQTRNALGVLFDRYANDVTLTDEQRKWFGDRTPAYRRDLISRTESTRASGAGEQAMLTEWGAPRKEWLAARDARTRESHAGAGGQVVATDKPFKVGRYKMMHPGDMSLGALVSEIARCRCGVAPVLEKD